MIVLALSLVWSRIPAWGAGDLGFKSQRPHSKLSSHPLLPLEFPLAIELTREIVAAYGRETKSPVHSGLEIHVISKSQGQIRVILVGRLL